MRQYSENDPERRLRAFISLQRFLHKWPTIRAINKRLFPTVNHFFCGLLADPFAAHFFAEIRSPALLPGVNDAEQADEFEILGMRREV